MALSCSYLIPVAATYQPPKFPVSLWSIHGTGRGMFSSRVSSAIYATASPTHRFRGRRCLLFNGKLEPISTRFRCNFHLAPDIAPATAAAYGALLTAGGLFAYKRPGSKGLLVGGLTGGSLMAAHYLEFYWAGSSAECSIQFKPVIDQLSVVAYFLMQAADMEEIGEALAFGSTFLFASVFGIRLAAIRKITPAGPLLGLSICALVVFISSYLPESL